MPAAGIEPAIQTSLRPQTCTLDSAATGTGNRKTYLTFIREKILKLRQIPDLYRYHVTVQKPMFYLITWNYKYNYIFWNWDFAHHQPQRNASLQLCSTTTCRNINNFVSTIIYFCFRCIGKFKCKQKIRQGGDIVVRIVTRQNKMENRGAVVRFLATATHLSHFGFVHTGPWLTQVPSQVVRE
jgi:hypothetical protein